jgi:tetratricopeptide (TPR) repeat protein
LFYRNRASGRIDLDRLEEAEQDCEQARALAPDHPYTHTRLGDLALARGVYSAAVDHYTAAIERQPDAGFYFGRGLAHLAMGNPDQAQADYRSGISHADHTAIVGALKELDKFATKHPETTGLDAVRALLSSPQAIPDSPA